MLLTNTFYVIEKAHGGTGKKMFTVMMLSGEEGMELGLYVNFAEAQAALKQEVARKREFVCEKLGLPVFQGTLLECIQKKMDLTLALCDDIHVSLSVEDLEKFIAGMPYIQVKPVRSSKCCVLDRYIKPYIKSDRQNGVLSQSTCSLLAERVAGYSCVL